MGLIPIQQQQNQPVAYPYGAPLKQNNPGRTREIFFKTLLTITKITHTQIPPSTNSYLSVG